MNFKGHWFLDPTQSSVLMTRYFFWGALYLSVFEQPARTVVVGRVDSGFRSELVFVHGHKGHERLGDKNLFFFRSEIKDL